MKYHEFLLLKAFCYDNFKSNDFKVTYMPLSNKAIVKNANGECTLLVAKKNNIVECYVDNSKKPFKTFQFGENFYFKNSCYFLEYVWKLIK